MAAAGSGATAPARLAIFDLDGTITRHDTLVPYLSGYAARNPAGLWRLWRLPFSLARFALGLSDRGRLKSSLIRQVMYGANREQVHAWSGAFCESRLSSLIIPGALTVIEKHRAAGDRLVLLSASVDLYVPAIGRRLGFDETHCTGVAWKGERLDGHLTTENRRGAEKRRVVEALRVRYPGARMAAYGNARSDFEHLLAVDEPLVVNASPATQRHARAAGLPCADWR
jgi:HAD superfamily hydrolase (TIGR01490 family)